MQTTYVSTGIKRWALLGSVVLLYLALLGLPGLVSGGLGRALNGVWRHVLTLAIWLALTAPVRSTSVWTHIWAFTLGIFVAPAAAAVWLWPLGMVLGLEQMSVYVVPLVEEVVKLIPIAILLLYPAFGPGRAGWGLVDFATLGLAAGTGFQLSEEQLRLRFGVVPNLQFVPDWGPLSLFPHTLVNAGAADTMDRVFFLNGPGPAAMGHGVWTGVICLGLAVPLVLGARPGRLRWAPPAVATGLVLWEHTAFNFQAVFGNVSLPVWFRFNYLFLMRGGRLSGYLFATGVIAASLWSLRLIYAQRHPVLDVNWRNVRLLGEGSRLYRLWYTVQAIRGYLQARAAAVTAYFRYKQGAIAWPEAQPLLVWCRLMRDLLENRLPPEIEQQLDAGAR